MSEYWKSTPKYWCKHCKTYVRDTKLEKTNHEATPKHQGNLKRFLRDLHRGHEKEEKDKERAKAEVARLNGIPLAGSGTIASAASSSGYGPGPTPKPRATESQRKQQLSQLAEMGISVPDEFRPDMAMAGEWQVTAERIIEPAGEKKIEATALGVRKREAVEDEDQEELEAKKPRWGSHYRTHPVDDDEADLDALLSNATRNASKSNPAIKEENDGLGVVTKDAEDDKNIATGSSMISDGQKPSIKVESTEDQSIESSLAQHPATVARQEGDSPVGVVFKKRKAKNIRQK